MEDACDSHNPGGLGGAPPSARLLNHTASPLGGNLSGSRRAWWGYLKRWLETVTWVLSRSWLRQHLGANAAEQAPDMGDLLLHESAVAWFRGKMRRTKPAVVSWEDPAHNGRRARHDA